MKRPTNIPTWYHPAKARLWTLLTGHRGGLAQGVGALSPAPLASFQALVSPESDMERHWEGSAKRMYERCLEALEVPQGHDLGSFVVRLSRPSCQPRFLINAVSGNHF